MTRNTGKLNLRTAEQERVRLTAAQQKQIQRLYENAAKEVAKKAEQAPRVPSDALRKQYLNQLQKQLNGELDKIRGEIESTVKGNMEKTAEAVVGDNIDFLKSVGMPIQGAFSHVPDEVVRAVATGQLYGGKWSLSRALWKNTRRTQEDVQNVVAQGIAQNKSAYEIAKDLEKYVDPSARKDWEWSKVYPGTSKKVDYNAQRLARTMVSHAYQQSLLATTKYNPFVKGYRWRSAHSSRTCEICNERDGQLYSANDLPLDHPNGMCTFIAELTDDMSNIADRIGDWAQGKEDPELDGWYQSMGGVLTPVKKDSPVTPTTSTPPTSNWLEIAEGQDLKALKKKGREDMSTLTSSEKKGIKDYTGKSYKKMNSYLRLRGQGYSEGEAKGVSKIGSSQLSNLKEAQKGIDKLRTTEPMILRRGSSLGDMAGILPGDYESNKATLAKKTIQELNDMLTGSVGTYSSFISTTPDPNGGFYRDVDYIIYAPAGTRGAMIDSLSQHATEDEFLVGSNTRFLVRGVEDSNGRMGSELRVFLELLPD